ncbi:hypothetical protein BGX26_000403 [Mortierella sp. AD094]|nr:hypothetical protein BGX26_000403 [Mortierella sp. AD094]
MIPWRPLGMLVFGLTVIFIFIRLHGNGYDFPVPIARCTKKLEFPRGKPDRTFMEISGVYHDNFRDWDAEYTGSEGGRKDHGQKFMAGWSSQWHLGKKKDKQADPAQPASNDIGLNAMDDTQQWIWMTNIWHSDGDCGPGHLRQYRRRLDHTLAGDNSSTWELMYVHKFPGIITHSSLSKRIIPEPPVGNVQGTDGVLPTEQMSRESIRLAIVYKVVQDEDITHHSRVYHFGIFQGIAGLRECKSKSTETETCHTHEPFLNFDYTLPGSMPIKDFTLEHDMNAKQEKMSHFEKVSLPKYHLTPKVAGNFGHSDGYTKAWADDDFHVMIGQVLEDESIWRYRVDIESETTDINTNDRKWLKSPYAQWQRDNSKLTVQEPNMIDEESHTYGFPVQKPFVIKSADGLSFHIPVADHIHSLETKRRSHAESNGNQGAQYRQQTLNKKSGVVGYQTPSSIFRSQWSETRIDVGSAYSVDTDYGIISDAGDIMVLKTTRNGVLILKRDIEKSTPIQEYGPWQLAMVMDDDEYNGDTAREVLAMKVVRAPVQKPEEIDGNANSAKNKGEGEVTTSYTQGSDEQDKKGESVSPPADVPVPENQMTEIHNILVLVYGDGRTFGFDLDRATESSSTVMFLTEKYPVVIGK